MKKRLLATLLTLCMVLTLLPAMTPAAKAAPGGAPTEVWVNGENLTNGGSTCGGKATYNAGEKTLTLNGATINTTHDISEDPNFAEPYGIYTDGDLTIHLIGENFVTLNTESQLCAALFGNLTFSGTGSLTVRAAGGFDVAGNFAVPKSVSLSISVPAGSALGSSNTTFDGVQYTGLYSRIVYKGGVLRFPVSKLYVNGVDMLGSGAKPANVSFDDTTSTLTLSGAAINTASSGNGDSGIYADSDLTIHLAGANTVAPSGTSDYGIYTMGVLTFTGDAGSKLTVTATANAITAKGDITIRSGTEITATSTTSNAIAERPPEATSVIIIETGAKVIAEATGANSQAIYMDSITIGGFPYSGTDQKITYDGVKLPFPPKVLSVTPNSASAPTSGDIVIVFDMPMKTGEGTVKLNELTALTGGTWSNGNKTYTIPYSGLADSTRYTVKIENFQGATDNVLALDNAHNFTTTKKVIVSDKISLATPDLTYNGREQDCGDATITGITASGNAHWTYTYTAVTGTLGVNSKPLGAGDYTVKVNYNDDANSGEKEFPFTIKQADINIVLDTAPTNTGSYTYGNAMTFTAKFSPASAAVVMRAHLYIDGDN
ncbi:MAG: Ig-like domain-containing protein, partial [Oscillospiraceae bacterium]